MSYANFVKALELAPQCKFYTTAGGKSDEEIGASEKILGVTFSKQCKEFYKKLGYLSFFGNEIFGIDPYDDSGILEGNSTAILPMFASDAVGQHNRIGGITFGADLVYYRFV